MLMKKTGLPLLLGSMLILGGCSGFESRPKAIEDVKLTPITPGQTSLSYPGKFVWHDLLTPDAEAARSFYKQLFGWSVEKQGNYSVLRNGDHMVGGIVQVNVTDGRAKEGIWLATMSVADVDAASKVVKQNGGKILKGPVDMELRGRGALVNDPHGAHLILLKASNGDPVDVEPGIGDWLWNELWSDKPEVSAEFYKRLGGYDEVADHDSYDILASEGKWRAGIRHVSGNQDVDGTPFQVRWVPVVRVADPEVTVNKARQLGGIVWVYPGEGPSKGDAALISDTTGALFMVQSWSAKEPAGEQ